MTSYSTITPNGATAALDGIVESRENGLIVLSPSNRRAVRRVLYVNSYGGADIWDKIKRRRMPTNHLWGCLQLVRRGYEVALAEPLTDFYIYNNPLPHDLKYLGFIQSWLGRDGLIYCGHNVLYWLPLLRSLGIVRVPVVSLMFAREPLDWSRSHAGIIALTRAAAEHAKQLAPKVKVAHLGWGCDLEFFTPGDYQPDWFLSCGTTNRDHNTLLAAANKTHRPLRLVCGTASSSLPWPTNVSLVTSNWPHPGKALDPRNLADDHYRNATAGLIILKHDPVEYTACGFTEVLEFMAMARPIVLTRTGALPGEIDVELNECGLHVPANNPAALAEAIEAIASDPARAAKMGENGRALCERHYNINRYATELDRFFSTL
jgi:glycosyltransferase involved in cell wall biosynthesis